LRACNRFKPCVRSRDGSIPDPEQGRTPLVYRIDRIEFRFDPKTYDHAYSNSSAVLGLTLRERAWFSAAMTQRNIPQSLPAAARRAATAHAQVARIDIALLNAALVAVVLVVVLITNTTGAG
jgi:hypothetical protein